MPHLKFEGRLTVDAAHDALSLEVRREGIWVLRTEHSWRRDDGLALLIEGTVVEASRPLRPVAYFGTHPEQPTSILRLWPRAPLSGSRAVHRWLALLGIDLQRAGLGPLVESDLADELLAGLEREARC